VGYSPGQGQTPACHTAVAISNQSGKMDIPLIHWLGILMLALLIVVIFLMH
jgi:hypothetical protein